jgi:hypothetical protein
VPPPSLYGTIPLRAVYQVEPPCVAAAAFVLLQHCRSAQATTLAALQTYLGCFGASSPK